MRDIFEAKISCKNCEAEMRPLQFEKDGIILRAVQCPECKEKIIHPSDVEKLRRYNDLKRKTFSVKLRMVGNSHAVSIPKEIVDFITEMDNKMKHHMNDMVKLCFEDFGKLSLIFNQENNQEARKKWQ